MPPSTAWITWVRDPAMTWPCARTAWSILKLAANVVKMATMATMSQMMENLGGPDLVRLI